ncbi:hypothetical protein DFH27DRAFT_149074 [Peziza echinospora]|nr:hypothetical protein DFH27DRAFT_149074 [Peziza echinospora]
MVKASGGTPYLNSAWHRLVRRCSCLRRESPGERRGGGGGEGRREGRRREGGRDGGGRTAEGGRRLGRKRVRILYTESVPWARGWKKVCCSARIMIHTTGYRRPWKQLLISSSPPQELDVIKMASRRHPLLPSCPLGTRPPSCLPYRHRPPSLAFLFLSPLAHSTFLPLSLSRSIPSPPTINANQIVRQSRRQYTPRRQFRHQSVSPSVPPSIFPPSISSAIHSAVAIRLPLNTTTSSPSSARPLSCGDDQQSTLSGGLDKVSWILIKLNTKDQSKRHKKKRCNGGIDVDRKNKETSNIPYLSERVHWIRAYRTYTHPTALR